MREKYFRPRFRSQSLCLLTFWHQICYPITRV